ncbi:MAG: cell wall hydrolase [Caulobacteraceae bacterium]
MTDAEMLALCVFQEARGEPDDGVAAVARVVLNRTGLRYASDGTIAGTVLRPSQFSWVNYEMVDGHYARVATTSGEVDARVVALLAQGMGQPQAWARCVRIAAAVQAGTYQGSSYAKLTADTVLYYAPAACRAPVWATPLAFVTQIGGQRFFRDISHGSREPVPALATQVAASAAATERALDA